MRRLRAVVVDDEPLARDLVMAILDERDDVDICAVCADGEAGLAAVARHSPDVIVLDVEMPGLSGIDVAAELAAGPAPPHIVFATAYSRYAVEAFRVNAVDYVLKPVEEAALGEAMARVSERIARGESPDARGATLRRALAGLDRTRLRISDGARRLAIDPATLRWLEADGDYVHLHLDTGRQLVRATLAGLEERLKTEAGSETFLRIHRSRLVNLARVAEIVPQPKGAALCVLDTGEALKVSRRHGAALRSAFAASG